MRSGNEATYSCSGARANDDILQCITIVGRRYSRFWGVGLVLRKGAVGISVCPLICPSERKGGREGEREREGGMKRRRRERKGEREGGGKEKEGR